MQPARELLGRAWIERDGSTRNGTATGGGYVKIKSQEDFWAGLMFVGFGVLAIVVARDYPMGSALRMGPGYFPTYLGAIMVVIGAIMTGRGYRIEGEAIGRWGWRPLLWLSAAFAGFGLLIERAGFVF